MESLYRYINGAVAGVAALFAFLIRMVPEGGNLILQVHPLHQGRSWLSCADTQPVNQTFSTDYSVVMNKHIR